MTKAARSDWSDAYSLLNKVYFTIHIYQQYKQKSSEVFEVHFGGLFYNFNQTPNYVSAVNICLFTIRFYNINYLYSQVKSVNSALPSPTAYSAISTPVKPPETSVETYFVRALPI